MSLGEIASALVEVKGVWLEILLDPDYDSRPHDADCYTPEDVAAWDRGDWRYVGVTVRLRDYQEIHVSLWALEYGKSPAWSVDMSKIINEYPVPDLLEELAMQIDRLTVIASKLRGETIIGWKR